MIQAFIIKSPLNTQADLCLGDAFSSQNIEFKPQNKDNPFKALLNKNINERNNIINKMTLGAGKEESVRSSPVEALKGKIKDMGLPLDAMAMDPEDLPFLIKAFKESGFSQEQIDIIIKRLSEGPLTMDRIIAAINSNLKENPASMILSESSLPFLGRFLMELGLGAEKVKDILSDLGGGRKFGSETLRGLLLENGQVNLKELSLANVNLNNLKDFLNSVGVQPKDIQNIVSQIEATQGRISFEGFLNVFKSLERPELLSPDQMKYLQTMVQNLRLKQSLRIQPKFNRIATLLQSIGDNQIDSQTLVRNSPAMEILRAGTASARTIMNGGAFSGSTEGQSSNLNFNQGNEGSNGSLISNGSEAAVKSEFQSSLTAGRASYLSETALRQITESIVYSYRNNRHRISIQLEPKELGQLKINILFKNSQLQARIVTENGFVKQALEQHLDQLRKNLEDQGLNLERFEVFYDKGQRDFNRNQEGWTAFKNGSLSFSNAQSANDSFDIDPLRAATPMANLNKGQVDLFT
ncbi:MAG: flagellar hook-length control protein FliK [Deltaproteobacteria bacterium]|nr:flagellar hook-length control protein FliK [Deltaproteobacteria bacterium]